MPWIAIAPNGPPRFLRLKGENELGAIYFSLSGYVNSKGLCDQDVSAQSQEPA
jgi:NADH:ubiquinone oxidoreductase subunit F (NADH-binding)